MLRKKTLIREFEPKKHGRRYANKAQEAKLAKLLKRDAYLRVFPHRKSGKFKLAALVELTRRGAYWIMPDGHLRRAKTPNPFCRGVGAECVKNGFCMKNPSCDD
ncbi:MAG: hypothetical protein KGI60_03995 [Patescibacteria group bacterium]|nr:hypothetical protein [Patescibacteria group bacterium]